METKLLERVRALLAKAESTEFEAEAESLTAKAHELMIKYSIDETMIRAAAPTDKMQKPQVKVIRIDGEFYKRHWQLLSGIAKAHGCRSVGTRLKLSTDRYRAVDLSIVGFPADIEVSELLWTSLMVQASNEFQRAWKAYKTGSKYTFGCNFHDAFNIEVISRVKVLIKRQLDATPGVGLVLHDSAKAVEQMVNTLWSKTHTARNPGTRSYQGWSQGRTAGERADVGSGGSQLKRTQRELS